MKPRLSTKEIKRKINENKSLTIVGSIVAVGLIVIFIKMFIDLLPYLLLGLGGLVLYKLYKRGYLG